MATAVVSKPMLHSATEHFSLLPLDREAIQERLNRHNAERSLTDLDREILELLLETPLKKSNPCIERFTLYQTTIDIYNAALTGRIPVHFGVQMLQNQNKRKVYELLFNVLYHYDVLEEILIESCFFSRHLDLHGIGLILYIMLFDYQDQNFNIAFHQVPNDIDYISDAIPKIAQALANHKIKINGTLARMHVKSSVQTISQLIPNIVTRESYLKASQSPCYARVNVIKCDQGDMLAKLASDGYKTVDYPSELRNCTKSMCIIEEDFLAFSADCRELLDEDPLVVKGYLALQDMMSYRFIDGIKDKIQDCYGDIIVTESNSGYEIAHIACLLGFGGKVIVFDSAEDGSLLAKARVAALGILNVEFTNKPFACITGEEQIMSEVVMVICVPEVVPSTMGNKVDLAMQEGDRILPLLVSPTTENGRTLVTNVQGLNTCLSTALAIQRAKYIVYTTKSNCNNFNEKIVTKQLEKFNEIATTNNYLQYEFVSSTPHDKFNFFTAIIEQEVRPETPPSEVIARAIAKGLIDGTGLSSNKHIRKIDSNRKPKKTVKPYRASFSSTISYQQKCVQKKESGPKSYERPIFKF